jgi:uncharacterized protein YegL
MTNSFRLFGIDFLGRDQNRFQRPFELTQLSNLNFPRDTIQGGTSVNAQIQLLLIHLLIL